MPERPIGAVSKTVVPARVPGVRIPPSPPSSSSRAPCARSLPSDLLLGPRSTEQDLEALVGSQRLQRLVLGVSSSAMRARLSRRRARSKLRRVAVGAPRSRGATRTRSEAPSRRGVRVAEGARLESVYTGNRIEGSNPSLSAIFRTRCPARSEAGAEEGRVRRNGTVRTWSGRERSSHKYAVSCAVGAPASLPLPHLERRWGSSAGARCRSPEARACCARTMRACSQRPSSNGLRPSSNSVRPSSSGPRP